MTSIPREKLPDSTLVLLREGYRFIPNRVRKHGSDIFRTRLMLRDVICVHGADAAEMFYTEGNFTRVGAMPPTTNRLLQDKGSVQSLDGRAHRHRKAMFMAMMTPERIAQMLDIAERAWLEAIAEWAKREEIVLLAEVERILCRAACEWAGIQLGSRNLSRRTSELSAMVAGAGAIGPTMWKAQLLRQRSERWARKVIRRVRSGELEVPDGSPVEQIANHRDLHGELLSVKHAAVELLNILRPTVAIGHFIVHEAHALERYPESRRLAGSSYESDREQFVQEVRRFSPFFPFIGGVALRDISWRGHRIREGQWVLLDLYGTNRDPRAWDNPDTFDPGQMNSWDGSAFSLIPQGAGEFETGHRCPGEWLTIALMKQAAHMLTNRMTYSVPKQDLSLSLNEFPAIAASGFVMRNVAPR